MKNYISYLFAALISSTPSFIKTSEYKAQAPAYVELQQAPIRSQETTQALTPIERLEAKVTLLERNKENYRKGLTHGITASAFVAVVTAALIAVATHHSSSLTDTSATPQPCTIPATIDPATDMNQYCWSDCAEIDHTLLCGQQAYSQVNATAGDIIQALQKRYGNGSKVCLSTHDCSRIDHVPYYTTRAGRTLDIHISPRETIKRNNAKAPKHQFKRH